MEYILAQFPRIDKTLHCGAFSCVRHQPDALRVFALLWQTIKEATSKQRVGNGPTPDRHDQHVNARETTSTSLCGHAGKVGNL
jgi:hypothetical protein